MPPLPAEDVLLCSSKADRMTLVALNVSPTIRKAEKALAGVAQQTECQPVNQRVTGSISSLGHMPGLWARSPVGGVREATTH